MSNMDKEKADFKLHTIRTQFPEESSEVHKLLYDLNLETIDRYGVAMSPASIYKSVADMNKAVKYFPQFAYSESFLKPEYIKSVYHLITVLHNLHKVTSQLIFTANLNKLYSVIIESHKSEVAMGHSVLRLKEKEIEYLSRNALQICDNINQVANESTYLEIIMALQTEFTLSEQWLMFTKLEYNQFREFQSIPKLFLNSILDD